jgi:hypothetical protein
MLRVDPLGFQQVACMDLWVMDKHLKGGLLLGWGLNPQPFQPNSLFGETHES